jgi:MSHA pilin protein MshD
MPHPSPSNPKQARSTEFARQRGLSLIELVMAILVISVGVVGLLMIFNSTVSKSADPMVRKQALAIAESMLNEVLAQPFSYCDPQDPANDAATPPASTAACTGGAAGSQDKGGGALGPQPGSEGRFNNTDPLDNVADYNGYTMSAGIYSLDNGATPVAGLGSYSASVTVSRAGTTFSLPADAVLRVDVTVTHNGESITLTGHRFRYAPNSTG